MARNLDGAVELIEKFEGFRSRAYLCPARVWTVGYGTTVYPSGQRVAHGDDVTRPEALQFMFDHLQREVVPPLDRALSVDVTINQYNALVSFIYNVGRGNFLASTLLRKLNAGDIFGAAGEFDRWVFAEGKKLRGLVRRREAERQLFEKPDVEVDHDDAMTLAQSIRQPGGLWAGVRRFLKGLS